MGPLPYCARTVGAEAHAVRVLAVANWDPARTPTPWAAQRLEALRRAGVEVELLCEPCVRDPRGYLRLWSALGRRLADERFDLVAPLYGSLLGLLCAVQRRVPCVVSFAGSDLNGEPPGSAALPQLASQLSAVLARAVSVHNPRMRQALWWPPARRRAHVLFDGVDTRRFRPLPRAEARRRRDLPPFGPRMLFVALSAEQRLVKRLALARQAVARLDGAALDVAARVPFDEMPDVYAAADALLVTSAAEGSPNCIKEALACGVPVVTVDTGDARALVDGLTNCAVVPASAGALASALGRVIADGRGCPDGPARVAERYSLAAAAARFVALYELALR
jgi:glycosyltransferase involved in cell wall biosynthesis